MVTIEQVAAEILKRGIEALAANNLSVDECAVVQHVCHEHRDKPELAELIGKYTMLADEMTDGVFSAMLESQANTKQ